MDTPEDRYELLLALEKVKMTQLEEKTGIGRQRWHSVKNGKAKMRAEEIQALCTLYPEYTIWLATGQEQTEIGQISPMTKRSQRANG
jgi:hypothetical protein